MTLQNNNQKHLISIDVMKAICIILVIINHAPFSWEQEDAYFFPFYIDPAVPIFLMISGFSHSKSCEKKVPRFRNWFSSKIFIPKLFRILPAYVAALLIQFICMNVIRGWGYSGVDLLRYFLTGGKGPGGYYNLILFQLLLVFPLIYYFFKRHPWYCAIVVVLVHSSYELLKSPIGLSEDFYRLCILRYLVHILLGIFLCCYKDKLKGTVIPLIFFLIGFTYLIVSGYSGYEPVIFTEWPTTSMLAAPYSFALLYWFMNLENKLSKINTLLVPITELGKASYHIFLVQMVFFGTFDDLIYDKFSMTVSILISFAISFAIGYLFYRVELLIKKEFKKKRAVQEKKLGN